MKDNLENIIARDDKLEELQKRSRMTLAFIIADNYRLIAGS